MALPPVSEIEYNREKLGYYGEFGNGDFARIRFLQSAVTKDELDNITLITEIPGSEQWNIRDLFQRDVDMGRVETKILPYLKDSGRVKFFNPLTLVLLPIRTDSSIDPTVPYVEPCDLKIDTHDYAQFERRGLFSFDVHKGVQAYSKLRWNDKKVKLVAIDGQHRLSALKFWQMAPGPKDLDNWTIPVVILGIFKADADPKHKPASLLEIVRRTFVYINSRAEEVNQARLILLDDEKIPEICTQELLQQSHQNDCLGSGANKAMLPLFFFDWRGQVRTSDSESEAAEVSAPGAVLSIVEVKEWLEKYIIGDNPDVSLQLEDLDPPLSENYQNTKALTNDDAKRIRSQFNTVIYPGISKLLEKFDPFREYVTKVRNLEKTKTAQSEAAMHAFMRLRFGSETKLPKTMKDLVDEQHREIIEKLRNLREDSFDQLIDRDIGKRALVFAFSALKRTRDDFDEKTHTWEDHAEWFIPKINAVYGAGWFKAHSELKKEQATILTHICFDPSGSIVNYRLEDVPKALGSLLTLLVVKEAIRDFSEGQRTDLWDTYGDALEPTLRKGFRKEHRTRLRDTYEGTHSEFVAEVNKVADEDVVKRLKHIQNRFMKVGG